MHRPATTMTVAASCIGFILVVGVLALVAAALFTRWVLRADVGSEAMQEVATAIRVGAHAFQRRQYETVALFVVVVAAVVFFLFHVGAGPDAAWKTSVAFVIGAACSAGAGAWGMFVSVRANVRVAEAAAATGVIAAGASADPFGWKALRGASGSAFRLPLVRHSDIHDVIEAARHAGLQLVASTLDGEPPDRVDLRAPTVLFVGSEGSGLAPAVVDACARQVTVPMSGAGVEGAVGDRHCSHGQDQDRRAQPTRHRRRHRR